MKTIKYLFWLIILILLGTLIYQNLEYFMTTEALTLDLKVASWHWTLPELQNIAFFGICFLLGLFLAGIKGLFVKYRLNKEIKAKDATVTTLKDEVNTLRTELEVFQHDPYIKKDLEQKKVDPPMPADSLESSQNESETPDIAD